jgi:hydroxymethylpyrimidine/phosphomethylpyrimidine kinase
MSTPPIVLSIAATDSGGGAGLAADLTTFAALGVHGACVVTAVTAQDTTGVHAIHPVPYEVVAAQLDAVLTDLPVAAVKTGVLGSARVVRLVAERCAHLPLVVDPVLRATSGASLADEAVLAAYRELLLPLATVITPNLEEYEALGRPDHPGLVLTRGDEAAHGSAHLIEHWVDTSNDHGTGCTHASALAAHLAYGRPIEEAGALADAFVARQLCTSQTWDLGRGRGPIAHTVPTPQEIR